MKKRSRIEQQKLVASARTYSTWRSQSMVMDTLEGLDAWKTNPVSPHYQHKLIQQRLINLRNWRKAGDWPQLIFSLREGLHRNLGNLANPELYKHSHVGTKLLIDDYITEVTSLLNHLCDNDIPELPYAQKLMFFRHTGQSYGRSALMLSGGANLGMFHVGVVKALHEQNLLPRVISGSSAGSVVAALIGTRKENELDGLFTGEGMELHLWRRLGLRDMLRQKSLMDIGELERFLRANLGEYTFEEAFRKTRRIINITVSPVDRNQHSQLLNYLTTPHLLVWSAVMASCSVPGLFPPVKLMTKDRLGHERPYMASIRWVDGAIQSDLPAQRLGELYNVNHHIVSQTNPHVLPFITDQRRKEGWPLFLTDLVKGEVKYRSKQLMQLASYGIDRGIVKTLLEGSIAVVEQQYYGDVTIHPQIRIRDYQRVLGDLSLAEFQNWVRVGERVTWPKIAIIRDQTIVGQTLEDCIIRLKKQRSHKAPPGSNVETLVPRRRAA